ncbi:metal resistance protein Ycf1p [Trichomonascus vanleenenianus]|uniref:metal resistance protein Ycf1p n=1 Tax=Trichomonascus vanleenenianus TaxID=2268995 RepID=UPI003ECAEBAC
MDGPEPNFLLLQQAEALGSLSRLGRLSGTCLCQDAFGWGPVTEEFELTPCFVNGVVLGFPSVFLFVLGIYQLWVLARRKPMPTVMDWKAYSKLALVALQIAFSVGLVFASTSLYPNYVKDISFWSPAANAVALLVGLGVHYLENSRCLIANGVLLFYWLFALMALVVKVIHLHEMDMFTSEYLAYTTLYVLSMVNALFVLLMESILPKTKSQYEMLMEQRERNPIETANIFSRLTFNWMSGLMKRGYETFLTEEDLPELPSEDCTEKVAEKFEVNWKKQIDRKKSPSLSIALMKSFGGPFVMSALFKAIQDMLAFVQPQLLRFLIRFVEDYNDGEYDKLTKGLAIAGGMFVISIIQTAALHQYFQRAFETGMRIKAALVAAVFRKSLSLSNEERAGKSTGDIVNLMSVDTQRLQDLTQYGQILWSGPFQIILCLASLYNLLGHSMWAGVAVMIIMIPINTFLAKIQKRLQKRQMENKDKRTRMTSEILTNVKSLKLYGWEIPFMERLNEVRNNLELETLKEIGLNSAITTFLWSCAPFLVSCSTFAVFVYTQDRPLTTDIVFPALTLFNLLSFPLAVVPMVVSALIEAGVAVTRLRNFLLSEELQPDAVERLPRATRLGEESVTVTNGTFVWERKPEYKVALSNINFTAKKGQLSCIVGRVGSGKSSMLQCILGDLYKADGNVSVKGKVAYSSQVAWIMNASVKDNILFGCKYDPEFYQKTIRACALEDDLSILPDGDQTMVGEKGISLSGGQKARLSLARAVYARADVYLLDDPLSAVDEHVGRHIIDNVLCGQGLLGTKTIILATNSITVLSSADTITMLSAGKIVETGTYNEVMESQGQIYSLLKEFGKKTRATESDTSSATALDNASSADEETKEEESAVSDTETEAIEAYVDEDGCGKRVSRRSSTNTLRRASTASYGAVNFLDEEAQTKADKLKERSEQGKVKWDVYKAYAKACNLKGVAVYLCMMIVAMALSVGGSVWLKHWSEVNTKLGYNPSVGKYLGIYAAFGVVASALSAVQAIILMIYCSIQAARLLHNRMLVSVMRAPMSFFETTPVGRVINRFSNDMYRVDQILARTFSQFFQNTVKVSFTMIVICFSTPVFLLFILPLTFLYLYYQKYYLRTSRELKRLDSVTRSPIYAHFQETLGGLSTVRAFNHEKRFVFINESRVDLNLKAYFPTVSANRWLAVRLEFIGSVIILCAAGLAILTLPSGKLTAGVAGLALSYALQITQSLNWIVRMTVEVENNIVSVERILEYSQLPSEAPEIIENSRPPAAWPTAGAIEFKDYSTRYRPELDLVLKGINLKIEPGEKIGIVGRTGAGKSSLTLALFRIIEAAGGSIIIDGVDVSTIGLHDLRQRLSIIPQDSQAFEGTIRENLDPENVHDDTELWRALELSHLKDHVATMDKGLDGRVSEGGANLSVGQRQLMSLARALLTPSKILVLDEATAAVDVETDHIIQQTIRTEFAERTLVTIAHRINTILDSDRVCVLSQGKVSEFASPQELLKDKNSLFYALAKQGGFVEEED